MQESVPSLTVTLPVSGAPSAPGGVTATVHSTVTGCPTPDGSGLSAVIVVIVSALPTVTVLAAGELLVSLRSAMTLLGSICAIPPPVRRSEEHTSELQSQSNLVCRLLLEKKNKK